MAEIGSPAESENRPIGKRGRRNDCVIKYCCNAMRPWFYFCPYPYSTLSSVFCLLSSQFSNQYFFALSVSVLPFQTLLSAFVMMQKLLLLRKLLLNFSIGPQRVALEPAIRSQRVAPELLWKSVAFHCAWRRSV